MEAIYKPQSKLKDNIFMFIGGEGVGGVDISFRKFILTIKPDVRCINNHACYVSTNKILIKLSAKENKIFRTISKQSI